MSVNNEERKIWCSGEIVKVNEAKVNVLSPTSQFGLNVFEGIRCYYNDEKEQLFAFRLNDHLLRLKKSQRLLKMEDTFTIEELKDAFIMTVKANNYREDIAVRQTLFVDGFGTWSSRGPVNMFISPIAKAKTSAEYNKKGLNCLISSYERINEKSMSPVIKCGANYINSRMAQLEALDNGYDTAIFLNNKGNLSEGPGSCLFIVKGKELITPALTESILASITRDTIIKIARKELNLKVTERVVKKEELISSDEAFLCGSAMEITPVNSVNKIKINNGEEGDITREIHRIYLEIVRGNYVFDGEWITPIY